MSLSMFLPLALSLCLSLYIYIYFLRQPHSTVFAMVVGLSFGFRIVRFAGQMSRLKKMSDISYISVLRFSSCIFT